jgi:hypothetical protein
MSGNRAGDRKIRGSGLADAVRVGCRGWWYVGWAMGGGAGRNLPMEKSSVMRSAVGASKRDERRRDEASREEKRRDEATLGL